MKCFGGDLIVPPPSTEASVPYSTHILPASPASLALSSLSLLFDGIAGPTVSARLAAKSFLTTPRYLCSAFARPNYAITGVHSCCCAELINAVVLLAVNVIGRPLCYIHLKQISNSILLSAPGMSGHSSVPTI